MAERRRGPVAARFYVALALPLATVAYVVVQFVYLWEEERAGVRVMPDIPEIVRETFAVHALSLLAWLAIAAAIALGARRVSLRLYEAQLRVVEERERQALTDPLTGLRNRRWLDEQLAVLHSVAERYGRAYSVISIDADDLKQVNDTHGHEVGDLVIQDFASVLRATVRSADQCVRLGGDEFIVLLPDTGLAAAILTADRIMEALHQRRAGRAGPSLYASAGAAEWLPGIAPQDVLRRADALLYEAKRLGKDRVASVPPRPWTEFLPVRPPSEPHVPPPHSMAR